MMVNNKNNGKIRDLNCLLLILLLAGLAIVPGLADANGGGLADTPWPMFQHDTRHTGCSPYVGPQTANLKWTFALKKDIGIYTMSPAIAGDGTLYVGGYNGSNLLYAVNPEDGTEKWPLWAVDMNYTPAIGSDGTIYLNQYSAGNYNRLVAYRPDGTSKYFYNIIGTGNGMTCSPAIGPDSTLYFTIDSGNMLYAGRDNGSSLNEIWKYTVAEDFKWQSPALSTSGPNSGTIYINTTNHLYAINSSTGGLKWRLRLDFASIYTAPAIGADGTIYINDGSGGLVAITDTVSEGGKKKWEYNIAGTGLASPAIGPDGTIYIGNNNDSPNPSAFWAITDNGTDPNRKWVRTDLKATNASAAIGADGTVYFQNSHGMFYALNGADGTTKWSYNLGFAGNSAAAIDAGGCVYVGTAASKLFAFAPPVPTVTSVAPSQGIQGQTLTVIITGTNFFGSPGVSFSGAGITVNSVTVDSLTQLTASITIAGGCAPGFRDITVETGGGTATKTAGFTVNSLPPPPPPGPQLIGTGAGSTGGSSGSVPSSITTTQPVVNATIIIQSASISRSQTSGDPVTVSATVSNTSTVNGVTKVKLYINGQLDSEQVVSVASGRQMPVSFMVSRNEPGTYQVYINGTPAGSFTVSDNSTILYVSIACLLLAFVLGVILIYGRFVA